jgi:hypothetical protein
MTGDGLADYLILYDGGAVRAFHNTGNLADDPSSRNFDDWGTVASGVSGVSGSAVRFADLNGTCGFLYSRHNIATYIHLS